MRRAPSSGTSPGHSQGIIADVANQLFPAIEQSDVAKLHNGGLIALRACVVIKLGTNGLISRIDAYFDPAKVDPLLS
jgi:hypothetical protein